MGLGEAILKAVESGAKLELRAKTDHLEFDDSEVFRLASLGHYVLTFAELEFDIDQTIACVVERKPDVARAISRTFPHSIEEKAAFIVYVHVLIPQLRECGDLEGSMPLQFLFYRILELFDQRNAVVHGHPNGSVDRDGEFEMKVKKFKKLDRRTLVMQQFEFDSSFVRHSLNDVHYVQTFLWRAQGVLTGDREPSAEREELLTGRKRFEQLKTRLLQGRLDVEVG